MFVFESVLKPLFEDYESIRFDLFNYVLADFDTFKNTSFLHEYNHKNTRLTYTLVDNFIVFSRVGRSNTVVLINCYCNIQVLRLLCKLNKDLNL